LVQLDTGHGDGIERRNYRIFVFERFSPHGYAYTRAAELL